jgi:hypothetical protein
MSNFKLVQHLTGYVGDARVYSDGERHVMVSRADTFDRGDETMIFSWDAVKGKVDSWLDLYAGYGVTHEEALLEWQQDQ